jgi:signal transduction histidine kinase/CheY-like chemotaxis protein
MARLLLPWTKQRTVQPMKTTAVEIYRPCELTHAPAFSREHQSKGGGIGGSAATLIHDLQQADRRKDEFLAMLGHEMRNPLAPIRSAVEIFRLKGAADPELRAVTAMVERQIQQLTRLVDDLLEVSRVGHGKINLQLKSVHLKDVMALAIEIGRPLIDSRKHSLTVSLPSYDVDVEGDLGRLAQVVSNLLNNSSKYMDDGGHIELILETVGRWAVMSVRDTGIGIEASVLPRIFDLFMQVNGSISRVNEGLGIGLALVRDVVELHGGTVQGASAGLGHGTEFVVRLPLLETPTILHANGRQKIASTVNAPTKRILIIDDNKDATDSMAMLLRTAGHEVRTAYDGRSALVLCRLEAPEVVICDISMPDMSGYELARELREDISFRDTFLIALSGYAQDEDRLRSQEAGFHAHLTKPVQLESLKELLTNLHLLTGAS